MPRFDTVPLSAMMDYTIYPPVSGVQVEELGRFSIRDAWTRPSLLPGHQGTECCYVLEFANVGAESGVLALQWSPVREKIIELLLRTGGPIGPCELVRKRMHPGACCWCFLGIEADDMRYDPLAHLVEAGPEEGEVVY